VKLFFRDVSFAFGGTGQDAAGGGQGRELLKTQPGFLEVPMIFENFSLEIEAAPSGLPTVILGPSGCGKTTLLRLIAGLLKPQSGKIIFEKFEFFDKIEKNKKIKNNESFQIAAEGEGEGKNPQKISFVFQEPRLLPMRTILENTALPLEKIFGKAAARSRAAASLKAVLLDDRATAYPGELSGGQKQRAAIARAFAYPSEILLMDEPFQSLDIPLRLALMDLTLVLLSREKRLALAVTHDPREAVYMGSRVIVLSPAPGKIVLDEKLDLSPEDRAYGSAAAGQVEKRLIKALG
jgi:NitT/TauT family transport system ATP-binding protein